MNYSNVCLDCTLGEKKKMVLLCSAISNLLHPFSLPSRMDIIQETSKQILKKSIVPEVNAHVLIPSFSHCTSMFITLKAVCDVNESDPLLTFIGLRIDLMPYSPTYPMWIKGISSIALFILSRTWIIQWNGTWPVVIRHVPDVLWYGHPVFNVSHTG